MESPATTLSDREQANALCHAVHLNDYRGVQTALDAGADPNRHGNPGWTPLRYAAERGNADIIRLLIERGADIHRSKEIAHGMTYLHHAAHSGSVDTVRLLLAAGADTNAQDRMGRVPLVEAIYARVGDSIGVVNALIEAGASPAKADNKSTTPLHRAAEVAHVEAIRLLLQVGDDPNAVDVSGFTPLHYAVHNRAQPLYPAIDHIVEQLLAAGANPNAVANLSDHGNNATPLLLAAAHPNHAVVERLIRAGADVNAVDRKNRTPLGEAMSNAESFAALLAAGADIGLLHTQKGKPALLVAAEKGNDVAVDALLGAGEDPNQRFRQTSALHLAVTQAHEQVVRSLLNRGADHRIPNKDGMTPLDLARKRRRKAVLDQLEAAEAARLSNR